MNSSCQQKNDNAVAVDISGGTHPWRHCARQQGVWGGAGGREPQAAGQDLSTSPAGAATVPDDTVQAEGGGSIRQEAGLDAAHAMPSGLPSSAGLLHFICLSWPGACSSCMHRRNPVLWMRQAWSRARARQGRICAPCSGSAGRLPSIWRPPATKRCVSAYPSEQQQMLYLHSAIVTSRPARV